MRDPKTYSKPFSEALWELLYPQRCLLCHTEGEETTCLDCIRKLKPLPQGLCDRCSIGNEQPCAGCDWMNMLDWIRSAYDYDGVAGLMVRELKFARSMELAPFMAKAIADLPHPRSRIDAVIPVPIHWSRRAQRGFNQSELIAVGTTIAPIRRDVLIRTKATPPQARASGKERKVSLRDAFYSKPCRGTRLLLIDDVVTSGGTLEQCAAALKLAGASWVGAYTFARELPRSLST